MSDELGDLRARIAALDADILRLVAERVRTAGEIGAAKREAGLPIRSFSTEAEVMARFRKLAQQHGLDSHLAVRVAHTLIAAAVRQQESARAVRGESARRILVIGGAGKMGRWLCGFFVGQGHAVTTLDPAGPVEGFPSAGDLGAAREADVTLIAAPLAPGAAVLREVLALSPAGLVADIMSLKSHVLKDLRDAAARGLRVASLHPLFGPGALTLAGRVVAVCDCGNTAAADDAASLFADTALTITRLPLDKHDELMQFVLGLSHLVAILYFTTLARSGLEWDDLAAVASTTFLKEARTAAEVARESAGLYHEIQSLNRHSPELYRLVETSLQAIELAALSRDGALFADLMARGRRWFPDSLPEELD